MRSQANFVPQPDILRAYVNTKPTQALSTKHDQEVQDYALRSGKFHDISGRWSRSWQVASGFFESMD